MKPIFTSVGAFGLQITLDTDSAEYKALEEIGISGETVTIEVDGQKMTGCKVMSVSVCASGSGGQIADVTIEQIPNQKSHAHIKFVEDTEFGMTPEGYQDFNAIEARTLAWLHSGGDKFDPYAKSYYDANQIPVREGITEKYGKSKQELFGERYGTAPFRHRGTVTGRIPDSSIPKGVHLGASYPHKMEYAKGGPWPWKRPGVGFYPNRKFKSGANSMNRQWEFKSVHPQDIDFDELAQSVTRQDPLALVKGTCTERVEREENYVVIHRSLWDKSAVAMIDLPTALAPKRVNGYGARVYSDVKTAELRNWVRWAKEVRASSWHDEDRRKATFVVDLPKV